jgi:Rieske 2Fe-2S family protein
MTRTLQEVQRSLPADWYYDADHYRRELEAIWYRDWVCVGHEDALARTGDFFTTRVGEQNIIVTASTDVSAMAGSFARITPGHIR